MQRFLFNTIPRKKQYLYSFIVIFIVACACFGLSGLIGYRVVALVLLVTVSLLAITFDILPVLLSAALSAIVWDVFFIPPRFTIHVNTTEDTILLIMYFIIAMVNGVLTYKIRQIEKAARVKEERANSVALYNTILNSLSHELRTPLAAIIGATDNLQTNVHLTPENRLELIEVIAKASFRLNQQVENLLNISRLESGHIKPKNEWCDINELVYDVVKRVEENGTHRKIGIHISQELPLCKTDKGMLDQILYNLLNNAAIHTDPACAIDISATCHADILHIQIEDEGKGFQGNYGQEVFHKFSRDAKRSNAGSGLGLSIVKGFTEALGGSVVLEKHKGRGAKFLVSLPVSSNELNLIKS